MRRHERLDVTGRHLKHKHTWDHNTSIKTEKQERDLDLGLKTRRDTNTVWFVRMLADSQRQCLIIMLWNNVNNVCHWWCQTCGSCLKISVLNLLYLFQFKNAAALDVWGLRNFPTGWDKVDWLKFKKKKTQDDPNYWPAWCIEGPPFTVKLKVLAWNCIFLLTSDTLLIILSGVTDSR